MRIAIRYTPETLALGDKPVFVCATDGDTPTIQAPIRMLGMDAPELHYGGATQANPGKFDAAFATFLTGTGKTLDAGLKAHLAQRLDAAASTRHILAGAAAHAHFEKIVAKRLRRLSDKTGKEIAQRKLFSMVSQQVFDRYGRLLAYVAPSYTREEREATPPGKRPTFNLQMIQDGHATSLTIAPNLPKPQDLQLVHDAMVLARRRRRGLWAQARPVLHGFEYRWIVDTLAGKRQGPDRYCGDFGSGRLYAPQQYYKVPEERRLWFFGEGLGEAMKMGFRLQL